MSNKQNDELEEYLVERGMDEALSKQLERETEEEHLYQPLAGTTEVKCSCGKIFATSDMGQQHRWWQLQIKIAERFNDVVLDEEYTMPPTHNPAINKMVSKCKCNFCKMVDKHE